MKNALLLCKVKFQLGNFTKKKKSIVWLFCRQKHIESVEKIFKIVFVK